MVFVYLFRNLAAASSLFWCWCNSWGKCSVKDVLRLKYWLGKGKLNNKIVCSHSSITFFQTIVGSDLEHQHKACSVRDALKLIWYLWTGGFLFSSTTFRLYCKLLSPLGFVHDRNTDLSAIYLNLAFFGVYT